MWASLNLKENDEILTTNHECGALDKTWNFTCKKTGAKYIKTNITLPFVSRTEFIESFSKGINRKTKVIFLSHITSSTGLIFPVEKICNIARDHNIFCIIDGAHVPAHIPLNIHELGCDFYTGACHKWLCGPKGSSFLFVKKDHQDWVKPVVVSWGPDGDDSTPSTFLQDFQWQGTRDMSAFLTMPTAIDFYKKEIRPYQAACQKIIQDAYSELQSTLNSLPISPGGSWLGQMVAHPLPSQKNPDLKERLWKDHQIEIPIFEWEGQEFIRISIQVYNSKNDVNLLMSALHALL